MKTKRPQRFVVRLDPGIWRDTDFADGLSLAARSLWFTSLIHIASDDGPSGTYPHATLTIEVGELADSLADELIDFGLWIRGESGYTVHPYSGCRVLPEKRAPIPTHVRDIIYRRDGYRCIACGSSNNLTCDHIEPWSHGGSDEPGNLQTMCQSCNSRKGARV